MPDDFIAKVMGRTNNNFCLHRDMKTSILMWFILDNCLLNLFNFRASFKFIVSNLKDGKEGKEIADAIQEALKTPDV